MVPGLLGTEAEPGSQEPRNLSQIANDKNLGRVSDSWEPDPRNPESIVPRLKMKEKNMSKYSSGSKAHRNELSDGLSGSVFLATALETDTPNAQVSVQKFTYVSYLVLQKLQTAPLDSR